MGRRSHTNKKVKYDGHKNVERPPKGDENHGIDDFRCENKNKADDDKPVKSAREPDMTSLETDDDEKSVFPRHLCWVVFVWTLISRLWYVTTPTNWWILHPDEIYQTVEVAHTDAFGYGFRPYEYLPPPGNTTYSAEHARTNRLGMYSLRSFVLVKALSMVMQVAVRCGVTSSPFLVIKVFHVIVTSCLPLAVYRFTKALYKSRDVATLAAIFTSLSLSLNILGTHTLINSFISPLVFISLVPLVHVLTSVRTEKLSHVQETSQDNLDSQYVVGDSEASAETSEASESSTAYCLQKKPMNGATSRSANGHIQTHGDIQTNGHIPFNQHGLSNGNGNIKHALTNGHTLSNGNMSGNGYVNGNVHSNHTVNTHGLVNGNSNDHIKMCNDSDINANFVKRDFKHLKTPVPHDMNMARTSQMSISYLYRGRKILYASVLVKDFANYYFKVGNIAFGLLLGLCIYTRTDVILIPAVICVLFIRDVVKYTFSVINELSEYVLGFVIAMVIGGYTDHVTYGTWFLSVKQWFKFNIWNGYSTSMFGQHSGLFYIDKLTNLEPLAVIGCSVLLLDIVITFVLQMSCKSNLPDSRKHRLNKNSSYSFFIILFIYSLFGHKELRFLHNGIVLLYISLARSVSNLCRYYCLSANNQNEGKIYTKTVYIILSMLFSSHMYSFFYMDTTAISQWTYGKIVDPDVNICMDFLHRQADVTGVFTDRPVFQLTGYSGFHKDVPIFVSSLDDFMEYDKKSSRKDAIFFSHKIHFGFSMLNRISDFISTLNTPYVVKVLIEKPKYNYIVISADRPFMEVGFKVVFQTDTLKVLKRSVLKDDKRKLAEIAQYTPMGTNATLLEYEGDWLLYYGVYKKAEHRLLMANKIDDKRIGPFQLLMNMFLLFNNTANYNSVLNSCAAIHSVSECRKPFIPFKLESIYK